jgi:D-amino-acid dehydrogenase
MSGGSDVLIIGGGVIGVCAAYYLSLQGISVTLIDKDDIGAGSSYGNAGLIVPSHAIPLAAPGALRHGLRWLLDSSSPLYIKPRPDYELLRWLWGFRAACNSRALRRAIPALLELSNASLALFDELAASTALDSGYRRKGGLFLYTSQQGLQTGIEEARLMQEFGEEAQIMDGGALRELEPNVLPSVMGGVYYPRDAQLIPHRFVHSLARLAEQHGAQIRAATEVLGFEIADARIRAVTTTRGSFQPEFVVLATGAWSAVLARDLKVRLPIQAAKGYSITVECPATSPQLPLHLCERKVVVTPMGDTLRFAGTLELAGLDMTINRRRVDAIWRAAREYLPHMEKLKLIEIWRGLRPLTPDTLPVIGFGGPLTNLIFATGHGMLGVSLAPATGKLVAQLIAGQPPLIDLAPFSIERFN